MSIYTRTWHPFCGGECEALARDTSSNSPHSGNWRRSHSLSISLGHMVCALCAPCLCVYCVKVERLALVLLMARSPIRAYASCRWTIDIREPWAIEQVRERERERERERAVWRERETASYVIDVHDDEIRAVLGCSRCCRFLPLRGFFSDARTL